MARAQPGVRLDLIISSVRASGVRISDVRWRRESKTWKWVETMRKLIEQILKFGVVGVIATAIDFVVLIALTELLGINPVISATISFTVSLIFNYLASMRYVFARREELSRRREFVTFVILSLIGLGINDALMWAGTELVAVDYRLVKVFATAVVMVWNFVTRKIFLESKQEDAAS